MHQTAANECRLCLLGWVQHCALKQQQHQAPELWGRSWENVLLLGDVRGDTVEPSPSCPIPAQGRCPHWDHHSTSHPRQAGNPPVTQLKGKTGCFPAPETSAWPKWALGNGDSDRADDRTEGVCPVFHDKEPFNIFSILLHQTGEGAQFDPGFSLKGWASFPDKEHHEFSKTSSPSTDHFGCGKNL